MKTVQQELAQIGRQVSKGGGETGKLNVCADLLELWARMREQQETATRTGPWEERCIEQATRALERLRELDQAQDYVSWAVLEGAYTTLRLVYAPHRGRHVPSKRCRIEQLHPEPAQQRALATRLGLVYPRLVRWLEGQVDRCCEELVADWLVRGELAFEQSVHPRIEAQRQRNAQREHTPAAPKEAPLLEWLAG
jgi:hypothetical protein